jgi:hypothetical protein
MVGQEGAFGGVHVGSRCSWDLRVTYAIGQDLLGQKVLYVGGVQVSLEVQ